MNPINHHTDQPAEPTDFIMEAEYTEELHSASSTASHPHRPSSEHVDFNPFSMPPQPDLSHTPADSSSFWPSDNASLPPIGQGRTHRFGRNTQEFWRRWGLGILLCVATGFSLYTYWPHFHRNGDASTLLESQQERENLTPDPSKSKQERVQEAVAAIRHAIKK